jgi:outer membrane biosynthesis protein TonB
MTLHAGDKRRSAFGKLAVPVVVAFAVALPACGQDEEPRGIPSRDAQYLIAQLDEAERRVQSRACIDARQGNLVRIERNVANLPADVNQNVRDALSESVDNLGTLIDERCREQPEPEPEPTPTETTPEPTTTEPAPTTTEEQPTETQEEPEPDPEPDPDDGKDKGNGKENGGGNGNGNGNGGAGDGAGDGGNTGGVPPPDEAGEIVIPGAER